ncbi:secretoglobin family 3A member 2-like [Molossus molossus]|uniref:Secretoglobin family 3A member 2 n=1 Tax=Molossus molossus TaxID=27622 RepID=A0A7J8ICZ9_MOLMO|nr:secretoglobin family 3A member 2-like [Molossus molossus]KAF6481949.1 secretoglobin family 3A member 2 [Molossus molossus]
MKLVTVFLLVAIGLCSYSATAFFFNSVPLPDKDVIPVSADALPLLDPLKIILQTLGISIEHLMEGLRKCVNEITPEASESVTKLLGALSHLV